MRFLRVLPMAFGMAVVAMGAAPASADTVYSFKGKSSYTDSISGARRSNLGAADVRPSQRAERRARRNRSARVRDDDDRAERRSTRRESRRGSRRNTRVASLGTDIGASTSAGSALHGMASFYWQPQRVASGGWFNPNAMTAAHKTLRFGTRVRVTHLGNGRSVMVTINDRGPYIKGRIIDLSKAAAGVIGMQGQGVARVRVDVVSSR